MSESPVQRYVGMEDSKERLRPVLATIISNFSADDAVEMILRLVEAPQRQTAPLEGPPAQPVMGNSTRAAAPAANKRRAAPAETPARRPRAPRAPPPLPEASTGARQLTPFEWYTVEEAGAYLGVGRATVYNLLRDDPEALPHKKEPTERGVDRYLLKGQGIIALRFRRAKAAQAAAGDRSDADGVGDESGDEPEADALEEA